jgi:hypothetical protein
VQAFIHSFIINVAIAPEFNFKAQNALMDTTQAQLTHARVRTKSFKNP